MRLESMQDVFVNQLKDVLSAEKQITKALPKMVKAAKSSQLAEAFESHLEETEKQIERLEQVFESLGKRAQAKHCHGMEGLLKEGDEAMEAEGEDALVDSELIAAAQRVEHYEIAAYGTLANYAQMMGLTEAAELLHETLEEEKAADRKLTEVNEQEISSSAMAVGVGSGGSGSPSGGGRSAKSSASGGSTSGSMGGSKSGSMGGSAHGSTSGGKSGSTSGSTSDSTSASKSSSGGSKSRSRGGSE